MESELLPRLHERDIDMLLQEELIFNEVVRNVLASALKLSGALTVRQCRLSVVDETGETDLHASCSAAGQDGVLLIENKIDAAFQPRQPERYKARALALASDSKSGWAFCVLVAPRGYADTNSAGSLFDAIVSYEQLAQAIASENTPRAKHRAEMILRSVEQARSPYVITPVLEITDFWKRIHKIADTEFPELRMQEPGEKGVASSWVLFKAHLPRRVTLDWKIKKGVVDLSFWRGVLPRPDQNTDLSSLPGVSLEQVGGTTMIRIGRVRAPSEWTEMTDDQIRTGLAAALLLLRWYDRSFTRVN